MSGRFQKHKNQANCPSLTVYQKFRSLLFSLILLFSLFLPILSRSPSFHSSLSSSKFFSHCSFSVSLFLSLSCVFFSVLFLSSLPSSALIPLCPPCYPLSLLLAGSGSLSFIIVISLFFLLFLLPLFEEDPHVKGGLG